MPDFNRKRDVMNWLITVARYKTVDHIRIEIRQQEIRDRAGEAFEDHHCEEIFTTVDEEMEKNRSEQVEDQFWNFLRSYLIELGSGDCCGCLLPRFYEIKPEYVGEYIAGTAIKRRNFVSDCRDDCPTLRVDDQEQARLNVTCKLAECLLDLDIIANNNQYNIGDFDPTGN